MSSSSDERTAPGAPDVELDAIRQMFHTEVAENLVTIEEALVALESRPDDTEPVHAIFRAVHTIKGGAAMVGYDNLAEFAHLLEDALEQVRDGRTQVGPAQVTILLRTVDAMRGILRGALAGRTSHVRASDRALVGELLGFDPRTAAVPDGEGVAPTPTGASSSAPSRRTLRIGADKLDELLNLTGEIAVARERMLQLLRQQQRASDVDVLAAAEEIDRLAAELQEHVLKMRLLPVGPLFRQHLRTVRDAATARGKLVRLHLEGQDVEVDAKIIEQLRDPLTHLVRNAADHGIEFSGTRHERGKDPCGTITIAARHEGGTVTIRVSDDGAGLDRERILARARERGLVAEGGTLSPRDIDRLILEPGFSTAEAITSLSGRGVGLDVVHRGVEAMRGSLEIESTAGVGTTFVLRLPLTVSIIDGFTVGVGVESYVIPLDAVTECLALPSRAGQGGERSGVIDLRGQPLPFLRLRRLFELDDTTPDREHVVVVEHAGRHVGLVVDRLLGEGQAVVKPLGTMFRRLPGVSGSTILGNGRVALILDVADLLHRALRSGLRLAS